MLGIRLSDDGERRLTQYARDTGRPKSVVARDWIMERLDREAIDGLIRTAARLHARDASGAEQRLAEQATADHLRLLDMEDGGYDWGAEGPPQL